MTWRLRAVLGLFLIASAALAADDDFDPDREPELALPDTCPLTKTSAFKSMSPCISCDPNGTDCGPIWESQQAVARGDIKTAIAKMEAAVAGTHRVAAGPGPWAELGELYCVQATREKDAAAAAALRRKGLALLREHRCAQRMKTWSQSCAVPDWRNETSVEWAPEYEDPGSFAPTPPSVPNPRLWGFVPNPDLPPMCFVAYCGAGFQNDADGERRSTTYQYGLVDEDGSADAAAIMRQENRQDERMTAAVEKWCNAGRGAAK